MKDHIKSLVLVLTGNLLCCSIGAAEITNVNTSTASWDSAADAINQLGLDLVKRSLATDNVLLSPYSIQSALVMTSAGAAGDTHMEMARILHYPADESQLHQSFGRLRAALEAVATETARQAEAIRQSGGTRDPVVLTVANRLFGQQGFEFRPTFLALTEGSYRAPIQLLDFSGNPVGASKQINGWVEQQTQDRIRELIPPNSLDRNTRLVLVNAIYLKAPWAEPFAVTATRPDHFYVEGSKAVDVPTMMRRAKVGYTRKDGFSAVTIPYVGGDLQFLILLPDATNGLANLESKLTVRQLASCGKAASIEVLLHLPKFKMTPPSMKLSSELQGLGMKSAFDIPTGSANFDRMAPRRPGAYVAISEVFHKTFMDLDEKGTEAAAATAVMVVLTSAHREITKPVEVRVDHPFLFAIQHRASGACLFLGRMTDPRM